MARGRTTAEMPMQNGSVACTRSRARPDPPGGCSAVRIGYYRQARWLPDPPTLMGIPRAAVFHAPHIKGRLVSNPREPTSQTDRAAPVLGVRPKMAGPGREAGYRPSIPMGVSPARQSFGCAPDIADSAGERESACGTQSRACSAGTARPDRGIWSSTRRAPTDGRPTGPQK